MTALEPDHPMQANVHSDRELKQAGSSHEFLPLVYDELRKLAGYKLSVMGPNQTLQPTALVHEAWLRLGNANEKIWKNRVHFVAAAAEVMRHVVIDHIRSNARLKRGGGQLRLDIDGMELAATTPD